MPCQVAAAERLRQASAAHSSTIPTVDALMAVTDKEKVVRSLLDHRSQQPQGLRTEVLRLITNNASVTELAKLGCSDELLVLVTEATPHHSEAEILLALYEALGQHGGRAILGEAFSKRLAVLKNGLTLNTELVARFRALFDALWSECSRHQTASLTSLDIPAFLRKSAE